MPRFFPSCSESSTLPREENSEGIRTPTTFSLPKASTATHAVSAESMPPLKPKHDFLESILADVIARAEDKGLINLGIFVQRLGDGGARQRPCALLLRDVSGKTSDGFGIQFLLPPARIVQIVFGKRIRRRDRRRSRSSSNCFPRAIGSPFSSKTRLSPSKTSSSCPPTRLL